jgi:hypothetical protein
MTGTPGGPRLGKKAHSALDPIRPQIVIDEPMPDGSLKLIGADYLVLAHNWLAQHRR